MSDNPGTNLVQYEAWDESDAADLAASTSDGGGDYYKLSEGTHVLFVLPGVRGVHKAIVGGQFHMWRDPADDSFHKVICSRKETGRCLVCDVQSSLAASRDPGERKLAETMAAKFRGFAQVLPASDPESGVKVLEFGWMVFKGLRACGDPLTGAKFTDPQASIPVVIKRKGSGPRDTEYTVALARTPGRPLPPEALSGMGDLSKCVRLLEDHEVLAHTSSLQPSSPPGAGARGGAVRDAELDDLPF